MTDKEKLIARLNASFEMQYSKRGLITAKHTADDLISYGVTFAKDTNVPSWIPVTERLPEIYKPVLVCVWGKYSERHIFVVSELLDDKEQKWSAVAGFEVTHWMPLPAPPKEE